ncbi:hypothetical protein QAD02_024170 [Eretmocerus hayati]|uniref:Uncharacterized protein n=1 Tax=Eretmocerus hayati TaxID=131215 RepID=A0ACC2PXP2_9HYME|nr:hypothetical protein QAD02_024170 [Eretmocerus hayati]
MADVYRNWIANIQKLELDEVVANLQLIQGTKPENERYLFKLLLHLSHCADRCLKENLSKETQVFEIADKICKALRGSEDKDKLFSALYYIIQYLLKKSLFYGASVITKYLFPGKIIREDDRLTSARYYQIACLWQSEILKRLDTVPSGILLDNSSEDISSYVELHMQILWYCDRVSDYTLKAAEIYIRKISNTALNDAAPCLLKIFSHLSKYLTNTEKSAAPEVFGSIVIMIGVALFRRIDAKDNPNILQFFRQADSLFLDAFSVSSQYYNCYKFLREYTYNIFETNFMTNGIGEVRFSKTVEVFGILFQKYGDSHYSLIKTVVAVSNSFEILFSNLESIVMNQSSETTITQDDLTKIGKLVKSLYSLVKKNEFSKSYSCRKCLEPKECLVKTDLYNSGFIVNSFLKVVAKFSSETLTEKLFKCAKDLMEILLSTFYELKQSGCKYSIPMWDMCGRTIFNIGLISESKYPADLQFLYEELCKQVIVQDGLNSKLSSFGLESPVSTTLHRLCNSLFNQGKYMEAMTFTAYNALLSTNESRRRKAYDLWTNIKVKCSDSKEIQDLTLLQCVRDGNSVIKEKFDIHLTLHNYDLGDFCLRELKTLYTLKTDQKSLMTRILRELECMNNGLIFAQGVLLLCFHALQFQYCKRELVTNEIMKAMEILEKQEETPGSACLKANLKFFIIIEKLCIRNQAIRQQIDEAKFTIKAFQVFRGKCIGNETEIEDDITPTYGGIDIEADNKLAKELREVLISWDKCLQDEKSINSISLDWEPKFTLETIIICGEYCRLFKFSTLEEKCWKLCYKLASALQDHSTRIYVTSRSISLRSINDAWIADAEVQSENMKNSTKAIETDSCILFWLSLADFYLDCNKIDEAKILIQKVKSLPNFKMLDNPKLYLYATDIQLRNYHLLIEIPSQQEYFHLMVEIHYLMINLDETLTQDTCRFWNLRFHLFTCEQLFECMCNVVIPMNSLLSYRETSSHLFYGMKLAQGLGLAMRIAEFLKLLCYIDLLRLKMDDCETKLQDLEHILRLESFQSSMRTEPPSTKAPKSVHNEIRREDPRMRADASALIKSKQCQDQQRCASPELKRKLFTPPNFLSHKSYCECFECAHLSYQQLCQSSAHLRAHMYSLMSHIPEADQHFLGAMRIFTRFNERNSDSLRRHSKLGLSWRRAHRCLADEMQLKIDFACHIFDHKPEHEEQAVFLVEQVIELSREYHLGKTSALHQACELYAQRCIYTRFADRSSITVPNDTEVIITKGPVNGCITPKQQQIEKPTRNPRRRKSPVALAIPVITVSDTSDDETIGNSPIPRKTRNSGAAAKALKEPELAPPAAKPLPKRRNVRRKILVEETEESAQGNSAQSQATAVRKSTRLSKKTGS